MDKIKENWFPNHVAILTQHGSLKILDWKDPNSINYQCRYVFDGNRMYISGDIGEAIFNLTWRADVHSFNNVHLGYFMEKLAAYHDKPYNYDGKQAAQKLEEWKYNLIEEEVEFNHEEFDDMVCAAKNCASQAEWAHCFVNDLYQSFIHNLDYDAWEWIYDIGEVIPNRIQGYLVGLQMASEQLRRNERQNEPK